MTNSIKSTMSIECCKLIIENQDKGDVTITKAVFSTMQDIEKLEKDKTANHMRMRFTHRKQFTKKKQKNLKKKRYNEKNQRKWCKYSV